MGSEDEIEGVRGLKNRASSMRSESSQPSTPPRNQNPRRSTLTERNVSDRLSRPNSSEILNSSDDENTSDIHADSKDLSDVKPE